MIHYFSAKNYYSFDEEVSIDFRVDEKAPKKEWYFKTPTGARLSCIQAIMGPNASGKTTALRALVFLQWFIIDSFRHDMSEFPLFMPFAGSKSKKPTEFKIVFEMDDGVYTYAVTLIDAKVLKEELSVRSLTNKRMTNKRLFLRARKTKSKEYDLEDVSFGLNEKFWLSEELSNSSLISGASRFGHNYASRIVNYWRRFETNIDVHDRFMPHRYAAYKALRYYQSNTPSKRKAEHDVRRYADLGIHSFGKEGMIQHGSGEDAFMLDLENESSGTQQYLAHTRMMGDALEQGGMVVIDELDAYLHPRMFVSLIDKFFHNKTNKGHAQLLLSAHDLLVLDLLDKNQINFAHKSKRGSTSIQRLDKRKGVRADDNLMLKYRQGALGAWPVIK